MTLRLPKEYQRTLLSYATRFVTPQDIKQYTGPNDPGLGLARESLTNVLRNPNPGTIESVDPENVFHAVSSNAAQENDEIRFRRYRVFVVTLGWFLHDKTGNLLGFLAPNNLAITLIDDAYALQDPDLLLLLSAVFAEIHQNLLEPEELPFITLAQLILQGMFADEATKMKRRHDFALQSGDNIIWDKKLAVLTDKLDLAEQLVAEETGAHDDQEGFLWGLTLFDDTHALWKRYIETFVLPVTPTRQQLREDLLESSSHKH